MSLTLADLASETPMPAVFPLQQTTLQQATLQATTTAAPTAATYAAGPVAGDNNNGSVPASATVMIVVGVVLGIVGVASVITLIWWMRRRHLARFRSDAYPARTLYPPVPPPKGGSNKALPQINVASANAYRPAPPPPARQARSNTVNSIDKDKALPIKPADSVWSPSNRSNKSPALASAQEMRAQHSPKRSHDVEMAMGRGRSDSIDKEATVPANFI